MNNPPKAPSTQLWLKRLYYYLLIVIVVMVLPTLVWAVALASLKESANLRWSARGLVLCGVIVYFTYIFWILLSRVKLSRRVRQSKLLGDRPLSSALEALNTLADTSFVSGWFAFGLLLVGNEFCPMLQKAIIFGWSGSDILLFFCFTAISMGIAGESIVTAIAKPSKYTLKRAYVSVTSGILLSMFFPLLRWLEISGISVALIMLLGFMIIVALLVMLTKSNNSLRTE